MPLSPNLRGALFMAVSMAGFTANDAIAKHASEAMNMGQVMLVRGRSPRCSWRFSPGIRARCARSALALHPMLVLRVFCEVAGTVTFLSAACADCRSPTSRRCCRPCRWP